jgi:hypothetical protein
MSRSDRDTRTSSVAAVGFCGLAVVLLLALVWYLGALNGKQAEQRQSQPHRHAIAAQAQAQKGCSRLKPGDFFECLYDAIEAAEETARTEEDLTAQQRAAWAAIAAAIIAFTSIPIGAVGLWALLKSLHHTQSALSEARIANEISKETSRQSLRAYVGGADFKVENFFANETPTNTWTLRNYGDTIAHNVQVMAAMFHLPAGDERIRFPHSFKLKRDLLPGEEWSYRYNWPWVPSEQDVVGVHAEAVSFVYAGVIRYRDAYGIRRYTTFKKKVGLQNLVLENGSGPMLNCNRGNASN